MGPRIFVWMNREYPHFSPLHCSGFCESNAGAKNARDARKQR